MKNEAIDTAITVLKEPVTIVNAGVLTLTMMDIEVGLKLTVLALTGIWTCVKILNEYADFKKRRAEQDKN